MIVSVLSCLQRKLFLLLGVLTLCGMMHGQTPAITGVNSSCDPWTGYIEVGSIGNNVFLCVENISSTTTVLIPGQAEWGADPQYGLAHWIPFGSTQGLLAVGDGPPGSGFQPPSDLVFCNGTDCTTYKNAVQWDSGQLPEPMSVSGSQNAIDAMIPGQFDVLGNYLGLATWATICDQPASFAVGNGYAVIYPPAYVGGPINCTLTMGNSLGSNSLPGTPLYYYDYLPPNITSILPSSGSVAGGTSITITGTLFGAGDTVTIGGVAATNVTITGHNVITATVPASISGSGGVTVAVTGPNGTGSAANGFVYGSHNGVFVADLSAGIGSLATDGTTQSSATSGGGNGLAVDQSGYVWSIDATGTGLARFNHAGVLANDYTGLSFLSGASALATDGNGLIWVANSGTNSVVAVNSSGAAQTTGVLGTEAIGASPSAIAVDEAGGVWVASKAGNSVTHIIGAAAPVVTPIANGVANNTLGKKPE